MKQFDEVLSEQAASIEIQYGGKKYEFENTKKNQEKIRNMLTKISDEKGSKQFLINHMISNVRDDNETEDPYSPLLVERFEESIACCTDMIKKSIKLLKTMLYLYMDEAFRKKN